MKPRIDTIEVQKIYAHTMVQMLMNVWFVIGYLILRNLLICRYTKGQQAGLLQESNNQEVTRSELCCPQVFDGVSMFGEWQKRHEQDDLLQPITSVWSKSCLV